MPLDVLLVHVILLIDDQTKLLFKIIETYNSVRRPARFSSTLLAKPPPSKKP